MRLADLERWRREFVAALGLCVALAGLGCTETGPDIVLVTIDTLRRDHVGCYGNREGLTPTLDALAERGIVHDNAYTSMPTTAPAHVSIFTGLYPSEHGVRANGDRMISRLRARELGTLLARGGYATAAVVASNLVSAGVTGLRGFEVHDSPAGALRHGPDVVASALAWLDVESRRPFFLWVHLYDPHAPYGTPDDKRVNYPVDPDVYGFVDAALYADVSDRERREALYATGVRLADRAVAELVEGVRARLDREPLWIVTADHGESLSEHLGDRGFGYAHGKYLDPETVAIPLILSGPGVEPGRSTGVVSNRDIYVSVLAAAGIPSSDTAGLRDLRRHSSEPRVVRFERRRFATTMPDSVYTHAAGATDGAALAIVGVDGAPAAASQLDRGPLVDAARLGLGASERATGTLDASTQKALRDLGYAQ